jgi:myo-inositol 2-dehydrogenase / D-chiro-inositol 1-dehydrogenase
MAAPENLRKRFRCAVLSCVKHDYVPRGMAAHPRFELVVVADDAAQPDWVHERNQKLADDFKIPYVKDVERALKEFNVDAAIVSPEAERHVELSVRAARAGKHVVQDKPLTTSRAEADRLVAEIDKAGVRFLMWNRNGMPAVRHVAEHIAAGVVGKPHAVHLDFYFAKDAGTPKAPRPADPQTTKGPKTTDWHTQLKAAHVDGSDGGLGKAPMGELSIEGIYPLAYLRLLTGAEVRRVFATTASAFHQLHADHDVEDLAAVTLELEGGAIASLAIGRIGLASHPSGGEIKIQIAGDAGTLVVNEALPISGMYYRGQKPGEPRERRMAAENDFHLAEDFAQAIDGRRATMLDAKASRAIYCVVEAAIESGRSGRPVNVKY